MLDKKTVLIAAALSVFAAPAFADGEINLDGFDAEGSVFLRITALEQDKVLMRLEKERAQLALDLRRIEAEKERLNGNDSAANSASAELAAEFEAERRRMNEELERFRRTLEEVKSASANPAVSVAPAAASAEPDGEFDISDHFRLVNITGGGEDLAATIEIVGNGHRRRVQEGRTIDGFTVASISADEGVVLERDGEEFVLGVSHSAR
ncbi:MAG: type IV pilus biogenesis protein PilP [Rickettsiales bacterium]|jgi:type IV pilus biogenesis protein PilP|nr:type IV pilus biogenesis protein PilP [Rickettsiales bacterium]